MVSDCKTQHSSRIQDLGQVAPVCMGDPCHKRTPTHHIEDRTERRVNSESVSVVHVLVFLTTSLRFTGEMVSRVFGQSQSGNSQDKMQGNSKGMKMC